MSLLKDILIRTPLFPVARSAYRAMFRPVARAEANRMRSFYGRFISRGGLVFDVGANQGEYAEVFAACGARVKAIEPNPAWRARLTSLSQGSRITPVFKGVGAEPGSAQLNVCSVSGYSTMLEADADWMKDSPDYDGVEWTHAVDVEITTLDALAREFGTPEFVKIDIEGFELEALKGMAFNPKFLSFEFGARRKDASYDCLELLGKRGFTFRPMLDRQYDFATPDWMSLADARAWLDRFSVADAEYGDMFCRSGAEEI